MTFEPGEPLPKLKSWGEMVPFQVTCYVYTRPFLRSDSLEMSMYVGRRALDDMYDLMRVNTKTTSLVLNFPEMWLNIIEQRQLYNRCVRYLPNLKTLMLRTHSVYIIQCTDASCIRIMDNDVRPDQHDITIKQYGEAETGMINPNKLTVLGG